MRIVHALCGNKRCSNNLTKHVNKLCSGMKICLFPQWWTHIFFITVLEMVSNVGTAQKYLPVTLAYRMGVTHLANIV